MGIVNNILEPIQLPKMVKVKQKFDRTIIENIPEEIEKQFSKEAISSQITEGMSVAIAVGSRGIANIDIIAKSVIDFVKSKGATPFIVPAMGSHGGATGEGQKEFLANYKITEETMGVEIRSSMEVVPVGVNVDGHTVFIDKNAYEADGIIIINRFKPHPGFDGKYECGLMKMLTIGLGKQKGAEVCHTEGFHKMARNVEMFARCIIENTNVIAGLGIIENAYDQTRELHALLPNEIIEQEPKLLLKAKKLIPTIIPKSVDVLIVDKIGKNFAGDGMDANVTRRFLSLAKAPDITGPSSIVALDLSDETHGQAMGIGVAEATTRRLFNKTDLEATYPNALTSTASRAAAIPPIFDNDKYAIKAGVKFAVEADKNNLRIVRVPNTLHLEFIEVSEIIANELKECSDIEILSEPQEFDFNAEGNLF